MTTSSSVWFDGPVAEAVSQVNAKSCVFVVFAHDESTESAAMSALLAEDAIVERLRDHAVAIELVKDTDNAILFAQLYPIHRYPSLFLLKSGAIIDVIAGSTTSDEIISKFDQAVAHSVTQPPAPQPVVRPAGPTQAPAPVPTSTAVPKPSTPAGTSISSDSAAALSAQEKKEKLKKQLEEVRKRRIEEKEKSDREKEVRRRQTGKQIQTAQLSQAEKERLEYAKAVKKEKEADQEHRRKLREQIESDKRERAVQRQRDLDMLKNGGTPSPSVTPPSTSASSATVSNLIVRQLDGSQLKNKFNAADTLDKVMKWIDAERTDGDAPYMLLAQFPTRQFSMGDESRTLKQLDLVPSGTLIMKPSRQVSTAYTRTTVGLLGYATSAMDMAYSVAGTSWNFVNNVMGTLFPASGGITGGTTLGAQRDFGEDDEQAASASSNTPAATASARSSKRNVHTLSSLEDKDKDPNQTYNGNSINQE